MIVNLAEIVDDNHRFIMQWFGGFTATLAGYVLFKAMQSKTGSELQRVVLKAFLVGDVLYVGSFTYWCVKRNYWTGLFPSLTCLLY